MSTQPVPPGAKFVFVTYRCPECENEVTTQSICMPIAAPIQAFLCLRCPDDEAKGGRPILALVQPIRIEDPPRVTLA